jgi:Leucine-rich repeat (LRR) protein
MCAARRLDVSGTQFLFAPTIPTAIATLTGLTYLDFSNVRLASSLPTALSALTAMKVLRLSNNAIVGTVPGEYTAMATIQ